MFKKDSIIIAFIIFCVVVVLFLSFFLIIIIYKYQKKFALHLQSVNELKMYHENELLTSQIEIQEQTFKNISREIHDNVGQKLSLAKLYLNNAKLICLDPQIEEAIKIIGFSINDLRDVSRNMSADLINQFGFITVLESEIAQLRGTGVYDIIFEVEGDKIFLNKKTELFLYRIIQEVLHNILKHAEATRLELKLTYLPDKLLFTIFDNGKGFKQTADFHHGQGLINISKRLQLLNGSYSIDCPLGKGTTFSINIPINAEKL